MKIKNLNIERENNDMVDRIENLFENPIFWTEIKKEVKIEINKLRDELDNIEINWTQNEQEELIMLVKNVLSNDNIDKKDKIKIFITIINQKIQNEIKEFKNNKLENPKKIIEWIKNNQIINQSWEITDDFLWKSDYILILFPTIHQKTLWVKKWDNYNINSLQKLFTQNHNINIIFSELIKNWYSNTYTFEWNFFYEISLWFKNWITREIKKLFEKYKKLNKNSEKNKEKLLEVQYEILSKRVIDFHPEIENKEDLLTYWIESFITHYISLDLYEFKNYINDFKIWIKNILDFINIFIKEKEKIYIKLYGNNEKIKEYITKLRKELNIENIKEIWIEKYIEYMEKKYIDFLHNERNKDVVNNLEQLQNNTKTNGIILKFWSAHFWYPNEELMKLIEAWIITEKDIKNIKTILKEKQISYIEITPKKED